MGNQVVKGEVNPLVETEEEQDDFAYDPQAMLRQTGKLQSRIVEGIGKLNMDDLASDAKLLESVSSFLNGVNNTAVQVTRNNIVGSALDVGNIADEVIARMRNTKTSNIRTVNDTGTKGKIPTNVQIELTDEDQAIEEGMLQRGLVNQTFDEFAEQQGITIKTHSS